MDVKEEMEFRMEFVFLFDFILFFYSSSFRFFSFLLLSTIPFNDDFEIFKKTKKRKRFFLK